MGKKKRSSYETMFEAWLNKCKELKYVVQWKFEPETFTLFNKMLGFRKITYTPDYLIEFSRSFFEDYPNTKLVLHKGLCYVDVKSVWNGFGNSSNREFPYNQRLMFERHGITVNKVVLDIKNNIFKKTFVPSEIAYYKRDNTKVKKQFIGYTVK